MAASTPSTTPAVIMASRYSVLQSDSLAGLSRLSGARRHQRDSRGRQPGFDQAFLHGGVNGTGRAEALGTSAQNDCVAGLETECARIRCDVRPALINHADDAARHADTCDPHAVGTAP